MKIITFTLSCLVFLFFISCNTGGSKSSKYSYTNSIQKEFEDQACSDINTYKKYDKEDNDIKTNKFINDIGDYYDGVFKDSTKTKNWEGYISDIEDMFGTIKVKIVSYNEYPFVYKVDMEQDSNIALYNKIAELKKKDFVRFSFYVTNEYGLNITSTQFGYHGNSFNQIAFSFMMSISSQKYNMEMGAEQFIIDDATLTDIEKISD
jgi:hypothetical protein